MPKLLRIQHPIARKEHTCMFCGCKIKVGEKYDRCTLKYDDIYDWVAHEDCIAVSNMLRMYDYCDDCGLTADDFNEAIDGYLMEHFSDENGVREDIGRLSRIEQVRIILSDIKTE